MDAEIDLGVDAQDSFVWSPNSTEIAFTGTLLEPDGSTKNTGKEGEWFDSHWLVNVLTKEKTLLKLPPRHTITDWSRDGKYWLTESFSAVPDRPDDHFVQLHLFDRSSGQIYKTLTDPKQACYAGRLSPDGTRLLCKGTQPTPDEDGPTWLQNPLPPKLWMMDLTTGKAVEVSHDVGHIFGYCWSPDGKRIAYSWATSSQRRVRKVVGLWRLVICDPDGKNPTIVLSEKGIASEYLDWR